MTDALSIALCEDDRLDRSALLQLIEQSGFSVRCTAFSDGEELLRDFEPRKFDLILMDIYMHGLSGIDTVARIRELDREVPVAFMTSSLDHALEGYRLSAFQYIEKPVRRKDVEECLRHAQMKKHLEPVLIVQKYGREERIPLNRVMYLEQQIHHLFVQLTNGEEELYEKLSSYLPQLQAGDFFSPHKSFAVNLAHVRCVDPELKCFVMQNGKNIPIRRESLSAARRALMDYLFAKTREEQG